VVIIGKTGVGKSAFIQLTNGVKFERVEKQKGGGFSYKPTAGNENYLPEFKVGYNQQAETSVLRTYKAPSGLVYCDLPGFKDTRSYSVDIATTVWINKIAATAKSIRFVLLIHRATITEGRGSGFVELMQIFTTMVKNYEDIMESVLVLFTHMSDDLKYEGDEVELQKSLQREIEETYRPLEQNKTVVNTPVINFMKDIKDSMKSFITNGEFEYCKNVRILNPVLTNIADLSDIINELTPLPDSSVQCSLSREVMLAVSSAKECIKSTVWCAMDTFNSGSDDHGLIEAVRLLLLFAGFLNTAEMRTALQEISGNVLLKYRACVEDGMGLLDNTVVEAPSLLSETVIELFVAANRKLPALGAVIAELQNSTMLAHIDDDLENSRTEAANIGPMFHRKCLVLKLDILSRMKYSDDFVAIGTQLTNLRRLVDIEIEPVTGAGANIELMSRFDAVCRSESANLPADVTTFLDNVLASLNSSVPRELKRLYMDVFDHFASQLHSAFGTKQLTMAQFDSFFAANHAELEKVVAALTAMSVSDLSTEIEAIVGSIGCNIVSTLTSVAAASADQFDAFCHNVGLLVSLQHYIDAGGGRELLPSVAFSPDAFDNVIQHFADLNADLFCDEPTSPRFAVLASKIKLADHCVSSCPSLVKAVAPLLEKLLDIRTKVESALSEEAKTVLTNAQCTTRDVDLLRKLLHAKNRIAVFELSGDSCGGQFTNAISRATQCVTMQCHTVLESFCGPRFDHSHFKTALHANVDPEVLFAMSAVAQQCGLVDEHGYYDIDWKGSLRLDNSSPLFSSRSELTKVAEQFVEDVRAFRPPSDIAMLHSLHDLLPLDDIFAETSVSTATHNRVQSVAKTLDILGKECTSMFKFRHSRFRVNVDDHGAVLVHISDMNRLATAHGAITGQSELHDSLVKSLQGQVCPILEQYCADMVDLCQNEAKTKTAEALASNLVSIATLFDTAAKYQPMVSNFQLTDPGLESAIGAANRILKTLIDDPLSHQKDVKELESSCLRGLLLCQAVLEKNSMQAHRKLAPRLFNYTTCNGAERSLSDMVKTAVNALVSEIPQLLENSRDMDGASQKLAHLEKFACIGDLIDIDVGQLHSSYSTQMTLMQTALQKEFQDRFTGTDEPNLKGARVIVDSYNVPSNTVMFQRYSNAMDTIVAIYKRKRDGAISSNQSGAAMKSALDFTKQVYDEFGGASANNVDHMLTFSKIDVLADLDKLRFKKEDYISHQLTILDPFDKLKLDIQVSAADKLSEYVRLLQVDQLPPGLTKYQTQLEIYLRVRDNDDIATKVYKHFLANDMTLLKEVSQMCNSIQAQESFTGITPTALAILLDHMKDMNGTLTTKELARIVKYATIIPPIQAEVLKLVDSTVKGAMESGLYATGIAILTNIQNLFSSNFQSHITNLDLAGNLNKLKEEQKKYHDLLRGCWHRSDKERRDVLGELNKLKGKGTAFRSLGLSFFHRPSNDGVEYKKLKSEVQNHVNILCDEFGTALESSDEKSVSLIYDSLMAIDDLMCSHVSVKGARLEKDLTQRLNHLVTKTAHSVSKREMVMALQNFTALAKLRRIMDKAGIPLSKATYTEFVALHGAIAKEFEDIGNDFTKMLTEMKFHSALALVDSVNGVHSFVASSVVQAYCEERSPFRQVACVTEAWRSGYVRPKEKPVTDRSLGDMSRVLSAFLTPTQLKQQVDDVHKTTIAKVIECLNDPGYQSYVTLKGVCQGLQLFYLLKDLGGGMDYINGTKNEVNQLIQNHLSTLGHDATRYWDQENFQKLNQTVKLLKEAENELKYFDGFIDPQVLHKLQRDIESFLVKIGDEAKQRIDSNSGVVDFAARVLELGRVYDGVSEFSKCAKNQIYRVLDYCSAECGPCYMFKLGNILPGGCSDDASDELKTVGSRLVDDFRHFKDVNTQNWNQRVATHDLPTCLTKLRSYKYDLETDKEIDFAIDRPALEEMYDEYNRRYGELCTEYLPANKDPRDIVALVYERMEQVGKVQLTDWNDKVKVAIPEILASIFAYYTIHESGESYNRIGESEPESDNTTSVLNVLKKPHVVQILTILRLLGCGAVSSGRIKNHLMQIGTGEGKSIVLGALVTIFALLGFRVRCVCYSKYLSDRDFNDFKEIFEAFGCQQNVTYSKITAFAEDSVTRRANVRELTEHLIEDRVVNYDIAGANAGSEEVLLVDEVDVFFGKDFYGQTYNQVTHLSSPEVIALIHNIWSDRHSKPNMGSIRTLPEYKKLIARYANWKFLVDNEIALMCAQVGTFDQPAYKYSPASDSVGYLEHDSVNYSLAYGYRTVFAYLNELEKDHVRPDKKAGFNERHLRMQVSCGQFSYANINPACILGVSGTLSALTKYEKEVMSRYKIDLYSDAPSVYGPRDQTFDTAGEGIIMAETRGDYFKAIVNKINVFSRDPNGKKHRAIIVFFDSAKRIEEFRLSSYFRQIVDHSAVECLTEALESNDRDQIIKKASSLGQVTLATKAFGRGTDFRAGDDVVARGGVHILQTFLSPMKTEEIQVMGRSARQGQKGSYGMVLMMQDAHVLGADGKTPEPEPDTLEAFGITTAELNGTPHKDWHYYLSEKRTARRMNESIAIEKDLVQATERDKLTRQYVDALVQNNTRQACELFKDIYTQLKGSAQSQGGLHVVFVLDESGSMDGAPFRELRSAYSAFIQQHIKNNPAGGDKLSVVMFDDTERVLEPIMVPFENAPTLPYRGGSTSFANALRGAEGVLNRAHESSLTPVIVMMTDGDSHDDGTGKARAIDSKFANDGLQAHFVAFGDANIDGLTQLQSCVTNGFVHTASMGELASTFTNVANSLAIAEYSN